jgi:hypothetical protein
MVIKNKRGKIFSLDFVISTSEVGVAVTVCKLFFVLIIIMGFTCTKVSNPKKNCLKLLL